MFSMLMTVFGRETGVPASTAGGGVDVAVGNICVGNGVIVGAGDGGGAAQAVNKSKSERKIDRWLFIFQSFLKPMKCISLLVPASASSPA